MWAGPSPCELTELSWVSLLLAGSIENAVTALRLASAPVISLIA
jgi:hypothetical protein